MRRYYFDLVVSGHAGEDEEGVLLLDLDSAPRRVISRRRSTQWSLETKSASADVQAQLVAEVLGGDDLRAPAAIGRLRPADQPR